MNNEINRKEINDALIVIDQLQPIISEAERKFKSARNWGFIDIFGGGFITDLIKHSQLGSAQNIMSNINYLLNQLRKELSEIIIPTDFNMNVGTFATFADFFFDGALADIWMQSKIMSSLNQIRELDSRLTILKSKLIELQNYNH